MSAPVSILPQGIQLRYVAEGSANIIYGITQPQSASHLSTSSSEGPCYAGRSLPSIEINEDADNSTKSVISNEQLEGKLLRLRKDIRHGTSYEETIRNFNTLIRPLFEPDELVDQILVKLPPGLVEGLNAQLEIDERNEIGKCKRPKWRHGIYLSLQEPFGLLVTDMTTNALNNDRQAETATLVELKPKWLVQSPSVPINARRCRTCALRDMREHNATYNPPGNVNRPCPLVLVSDEFEDVYQMTASMKTPINRHRLAEALFQHKTLLKLKKLQERMADVGLDGLPETSQSLSIAMTLRDCSAFVKVPILLLFLTSFPGLEADSDLRFPITRPNLIAYVWEILM
jgi:inositol-pentakisphosphate 2-kinase